MKRFLESVRKQLRAIATNERGVALIEFAYVTPIVIALGVYGLELTNFALAHMRVSQVAGNLAATAARVGENSTLAEKQIRESDINDTFAAVRSQAGRWQLTERGRIILSSLERNAAGGNWIHWQRCIGAKSHTSSYGVAGDGATGIAFLGMGDAGQELTAPTDGAVMFVEIAYDYEPIIDEALLGPQTIRAKSAFIVRERRDLDDADNPANPTTQPEADCAVFAA